MDKKFRCNGESLLRDPAHCKYHASKFFKNKDEEYAALCCRCTKSERFFLEIGGFFEITREEYVVAKVMRV